MGANALLPAAKRVPFSSARQSEVSFELAGAPGAEQDARFGGWRAEPASYGVVRAKQNPSGHIQPALATWLSAPVRPAARGQGATRARRGRARAEDHLIPHKILPGRECGSPGARPCASARRGLIEQRSCAPSLGPSEPSSHDAKSADLAFTGNALAPAGNIPKQFVSTCKLVPVKHNAQQIHVTCTLP